MKRIFSIISIVAAFVFSGCIKNDLVVFEGSQVEFDAAAWNANAAGLTYPILTRVPAQGTATTTAQPTLTRTSGSIQIRVNLVGAQRAEATDFTYEVVTAESTAVAGTHFNTLSGTGSIPANSSFGTITIDIQDPGATSGSKILVLQLKDSPEVKASFNYSKVGLSILQS